MSNQLYPTQYSPHPSPGALMAFRDGVFGQRPQAPYGQSQQAFENGVFGPSLGSTPALDAGPLRSFRDGIFNFPRQLQEKPHPVVAYQDGIFGGGALGQDPTASTATDPATTPTSPNGGGGDPSTTPTTVSNGGAAPSNGNGAQAPAFPTGVVLDLTTAQGVDETVRFMREAGQMASFDVSAGGTGQKTQWDDEASALTIAIAEQLAASDPGGAEMVQQYGLKQIGDQTYPTGALLVGIGMAGGAAGGLSDPAQYPLLTVWLTSCLAGVFSAPPTQSIAEAAALSEQACPLKYPEPSGISRATIMYAGAGVVGVGLLYLLLRK